MNPTSICWFRQDLRISDNPALLAAAKQGAVLPIYILDSLSPPDFKKGSATKLYLHHALNYLNKSLNDNLNVYIGNPHIIILKLIKQYNIKNIFFNHCYEPWILENDALLQEKLTPLKIQCTIFNGSYLWNPYAIKTGGGSFYKVFGAYKKKVFSLDARKPLGLAKNIILMRDDSNLISINSLELNPKNQWHDKILPHCTFGEKAAQEKLKYFIKYNLSDYKIQRDYPGQAKTSKLSAHLHFGEISPHQIWDAIHKVKNLYIPENDTHHFLSELVWREFSCYLLTHFKTLAFNNFQNKFDTFPWKYNKKFFQAWKTGNTGYPFVDAGMRELWQTGTMHNRVRMIVASFLVKNLMIHWHYGRDWFWDCLLDADLANNSASWQWVAGSGVDAAPYFRIFNPVIQGEKFDKEGEYTKKFIPELKKLPNKYLFKPWEAPEKILENAGIVLGKDYPKPIVDLKESRETALIAYKLLKNI